MAKKRDPYMDQATQQALVRFGPQLDGLRALMANADQNFKAALGQAEGSRVAVQGAVQQTLPVARGIYDEADQRSAFVRGVVDNDLAKLGPVGGVSNAISQAITLERAGSADRITRGRASTLGDLAQQSVRAAAGEQYAKQGARTRYESDVEKILAQAQGVAGQQGAFTAATAQDLRDAAAQRAQALEIANNANATRITTTKINARTSERNARLSASARRAAARATHNTAAASLAERTRHDLAMEANAARGGGSSGGSKYATPSQHHAIDNGVQLALPVAKQYKAAGMSRAALAKLLLNGAPAAVAAEDDGKVKKGDKLPAIKPVTKDQLIASVALDLAYDGRVSYANFQKLRKLKLNVKALGYPANRQPRPPAQRASGADFAALLKVFGG